MGPTNQAEHLIQIWARKKFASSHIESDFYSIDGPEGHREYGCPTCGDDTAYTELTVIRHRMIKGRRVASTVETFKDISLVWFLNEILNPLEALE